MSVKLNSSGGGSVTLQEPTTASNFTLTLPAQTGTVVTTDGSNNLNVAGNLAFTSTGQRITGDFSSATTVAVSFQTSTTNGVTAVTAIPNGTSQGASFRAFNGVDQANASWGYLGIPGSGGDIRIISGASGTGSYLPMTFYTGGSERFRIGTSGQLGIGGANYGTSGQVLTSQGSGSAPVWASVSGGVTSLTAGNGITVSASTGAVTVSQDIYTGTTANNTSYPIGTCLLTQSTNSGFIVAESRVLYLANNNSTNQQFIPAGSGTSLTGTWRGRGAFLDGATSNYVYLYQRTA